MSSFIRSLQYKQHIGIIKQQKREIFPLIVAGIGILAVGTAAQYVVRTLKRIEEEKNNNNNNNGGGRGEGGENEDKEEVEKVKTKYSNKEITFPKKSIGIDVGPSYLKLSTRDGKYLQVIENKEGLRLTPSSIYKTIDEISVGSIAARQRWANSSKVGTAYHSLVGLDPNDPIVSKFLSNMKLNDRVDLTKQELVVEVGGSNISASTIYTHLVKELYSTLENKVENISKIPTTINVPNYYNQKQTQAAILATRNGGFNCLQTVPDPVAAIIGSNHQGYIPNEDLTGKYLVLDIGGRITQLSIVEFNKDLYEITTKKTLFSTGSDTINDLLVEYIANEFKSKNNINLLSDSFALQRIHDSVEAIKFDLTNKLTTQCNLPYITADINGPKHLELEITRSKFNNIISPVVNTLNDQLLNDINYNNIQTILLVGGGARIPLIQNNLKDLMKKYNYTHLNIITPSQPEEVISLGASVYSSKYN